MTRGNGEDVDSVPLGVPDHLDQSRALDRDIGKPEGHRHDAIGSLNDEQIVPHEQLGIRVLWG